MPVPHADPFLLHLFILRPQDRPAKLAKRLAVNARFFDVAVPAAPIAYPNRFPLGEKLLVPYSGVFRIQDQTAIFAKRLAVRRNPYDIACLAAPVALVSLHFVIPPFGNSKALVVKVLL
jgi:hypothetical protein